MLVLKHTFEVEYPDRVDTVTSTMVDYGIPNGELFIPSPSQTHHHHHATDMK